ncbi:B-box zinc finger protein 20 [Prunus yedoensis var. nudiflora]|uniref:B-box zinc finger protein 20 n=1 Tax=Prunus yedoensis var. nudiflora TaxID=2094558 RepID=A0A314UPG9_PRUYE|nr:B-box zinc finger protein 20 [Prunus yedoensis var. nudiflora]
MKIQCDVCNKDDASVFCTADEAALCDTCDHRVHHANKLASKHQRFSLIHPSSKQFPVCDICQERRAFLFCQQDRAILCRECDLPVHAANEHTQKHSRFLLTGVKLSATSALYTSSSPPTATTSLKSADATVTDPKPHL